jgi:hypothetical protein
MSVNRNVTVPVGRSDARFARAPPIAASIIQEQGADRRLSAVAEEDLVRPVLHLLSGTGIELAFTWISPAVRPLIRASSNPSATVLTVDRVQAPMDCPRCGAAGSVVTRFCEVCGHEVGAADLPPAALAQPNRPVT